MKTPGFGGSGRIDERNTECNTNSNCYEYLIVEET